MININLFDTTFKHLRKEDGIYSMIMGKKPAYVKYLNGIMEYGGITVFTDSFLDKEIVKEVKSKYKIGWIIEPPEITSKTYTDFVKYKDNFDFVMTYDQGLLDSFPNKTRFCPFGGTWVDRNRYGIYSKTKNVNILYSNKRSAEGHKLRHRVASMYVIDKYGSGSSNPFKNVEDVLKEYRYSIVIENDRKHNFFTEKLLNCFSLGTVPIYWGCPNIRSFFDVDGMFIFNNLKELNIIMNSIKINSDTIYRTKISNIKNNLQKTKEFDIVEDWMYKNIYKGL